MTSKKMTFAEEASGSKNWPTSDFFLLKMQKVKNQLTLLYILQEKGQKL
jgi:hypothetical protein